VILSCTCCLRPRLFNGSISSLIRGQVCNHTLLTYSFQSYFFEVNLLVRQEIAHAESAENTPAENAASEPVELAGRAPWALRRVGSCKVK